MNTLFKIAKAGGSVEGKIRTEMQNLQRGVPVTERSQIELRTLYLFCGMVANAKDISTVRKVELFNLMMQTKEKTSKNVSQRKTRMASVPSTGQPQADSSQKQAALADEQIKAAKAQRELMMRMNEEAKPNLGMNLVVSASYGKESDDVKGTIDLFLKNLSSSPTAILSIYLRTKEGSYFRKIGEPDGINLPLNIGARSAERVSFRLNKDDIKQLEDILVTDIDGTQRPIKPTEWNANVQECFLYTTSS